MKIRGKINSKSKVGNKIVKTKRNKAGDIKKVKTITKVSNKSGSDYYSGIKRIDVQKPGKYGEGLRNKSTKYRKTRNANNIGNILGTAGAVGYFADMASYGPISKVMSRVASTYKNKKRK